VIALQTRLAAARALSERDPQAASKEWRKLDDLAAAAVAELRAFQRTLSPPPAASSDLSSLARSLVENFAASGGLPARFRAPKSPVSARPEVCLEVAQILREALANIRKHARARTVTVSVAKGLRIIIEDDGAGFPFSGRFRLTELEAQGRGPRSIMQRVRALGGDLTLESRPGRGSRLEVRIPS
jgi:signal transduction histidine kinase